MDIAPILTALSSLGPWGIVAGIGVTLFAQLLRSRLSHAGLPSLPRPNRSPATDPQPLADQFPLLHRLAQLMGSNQRKRVMTTADIPHEVVLQLRTEIERLSTATAAGHAAALADLEPTLKR